MRNGRKGNEGALSCGPGRVVKPDVKLALLLVTLEKIAVDAVVWTVLCHAGLPGRG
jgi:hypothetical protein